MQLKKDKNSDEYKREMANYLKN